MRRAALITATIVALGLAACGDDDNDRSDTPAATATTALVAAGDVDRYCALARELDAAGEKFFSGLGKNATDEDYEAAERRFVERQSDKIDELARVAPAQIKDDVATLLAGQRQRAGLQTATQVDESESSAAETRIGAFEKRSCTA